MIRTPPGRLSLSCSDTCAQTSSNDNRIDMLMPVTSATLAPSDDPPTRPPSRGHESSGNQPPAFIILLAFHISSRHDAAT
jgi:hypothetical protein